MQVTAPGSAVRTRRSTAAVLLRNVLSNASGMLITSAISFLLPAFLVHRLDASTYSAWVLILNLSAYVGYLDFGVLTAVSKYVAECDAKGDYEGCGRYASTGVAMMLSGVCLGVLMTCGMAVFVPEIFRKMPPSMFHDVRLSIIYVGVSLSVGLAASTFQAVFLGLQKYRVPTTINAIGRLVYAAVLATAVFFHTSLAMMGIAVAAVNVLTTAAHIMAWRRFACHVPIRLLPIDTALLRKMVSYCFVLTIWSACMLLISGVDLTIVGYYSFGQAAYYAIAASPTNFMLVLYGSVTGPLLPATSALSTARTPEQMGIILVKMTRYATLLIFLVGLPLMVFAYPVLQLWVGATYATHASLLLRILLLANILRQFCAPYSTMVVATAQQRLATVSAVTEGLVNLTASVLLARHFGPIGVAFGTLVGSFAGITMHFVISMHYTKNIAASRRRLIWSGIVRPAAIALPSLCLVHYWWIDGMPTARMWVWPIWAVMTLTIAFYSLQAPDIGKFKQLLKNGLAWA